MEEVPMVEHTQGYYLDESGEVHLIVETRPYEEYHVWSQRIYDEFPHKKLTIKEPKHG